MALFDQTLHIDDSVIATLVDEHWGLTLGKLIKASQNHTFAAIEKESGIDFIVRVTPDPEGKHAARIRNEVTFVNYLASHPEKLDHVCGYVALKSNDTEYLLEDAASQTLIVVSTWARGTALNFLDSRWMVDATVAYTWGHWLGRFHKLSRAFAIAYPEIANAMQPWDSIHKGILKDAPVSPLDLESMEDAAKYGVLHGDVNISNFYFIEPTHGSNCGTLSVFDWDQSQRGWYLYDVAQAMVALIMLHDHGSLIDLSPVPEAQPDRFQSQLLAGYAAGSGPDDHDGDTSNSGEVDVRAFERMVKLRLYFYETFCRKAKEQGHVPADMAHFIDYVVAWFDKKRAGGWTSDVSSV